jgi:hypothetical protein
VYNINKGGNTLNESEILEGVHACVRELLDVESKGNGDKLDYTDDDVIAVTLLYSLVMGNRLIKTLTDERVSIGMSKEIASNYAFQLRQLTLGMTRVDTSSYYKGTEK